MGKKRVTEKEKNEFFNPMQGGVMWTEKYNKTLDKLWSKLPDYFGKCLATMAIFTLGLTMRGDWVIVLVHFLKQIKISNADFTLEETLEYLYLKNFGFIWIAATIVSYAMYFLIGGFLHWYFYVKQRDQAETWKCQPNKWMSPDLERHEIIFGSVSLLIVSSFSAVLASYIINGGWCMVYYRFDEYGWWWFLLQWPTIFIYQDYSTYWLHRLYHFPWLYKHFHKMHHKYKQPTAFSVTAIHPFEILHVQFTLCAPLFIIPIHWVSFYVIALYTYYHGIIDHSGINFKAYWWQPWQPDAIFHDNHHQYFHVNFGFNIFLWDKIHGTYRRKDRVYTENIFYGKGKSLKEVTKEELKTDIEERNSENPLAHRNNELEYKLTQDDLKFSY